jgi:ATP-binding cassette, subfamily B, bacterial MsbA
MPDWRERRLSGRRLTVELLQHHQRPVSSFQLPASDEPIDAHYRNSYTGGMATPTTAQPARSQTRTLEELPAPNRAFFGQLFGQYRRLLVFVRPYWKLLLLAAVVLVFSSLAGLALPLAVRGVVDSALVNANFDLLNRVTLALLGLFVLQAVFGFAQSYIMGWVGERVVANVRETLYAHLQNMPLSFFASTRTGDLLSRLGSDVTTIQNAVTDVLLSLLSNIVMFIGGIIIISVMAWRLTLIMLAVVPLAVLGMILLGRLVRKLSRQVQDTLAEVSATAEEAITGVRIVKSFAREPYEVDRYRAGTERLFGLAVKRVRLRATLGPIIGLLAYTSIALVLWFGSREVIAGNLTPGELISFLLYTMMIATPIAAFTSLYSQFQQALGASERVFQLLDTPPELLDAPDAPPMPYIQGAVQFESVCFDYGDTAEERIVLRDIDLCVEPGQVVALVGPSGAGKTTLVNLIPRFYDPTEGRILVDGHDIRLVQMRSLREQIGIVPQETALFSGTVRDNIAYGKLDAPDDEIEDAARAANAHDFIRELPQGYATPVGERGVKLSGGQRQRVAIARALLKNPRILILDEATSSLDSESEQAVQEALERLMRDRTTFVIAHRLSTITNADWIVVLDGGRIAEQGRHADLVGREGGLYRRMHALQFRWDDGTA